ncbi:MAG: PEP-CTERM sorting domain-containing protein [Tepidisphaeraceae bacterium]
MKNSKLTLAGAAAATVLALAGAAQAAPLVNVSVLARPSGSVGAFADSIQVEAGQSYEYQVHVSMASIGTQNTQGATTRTINTLNHNPASSTQGDGVNSMSFDLLDVDGDGAAISFGAVGQLATSGAASWASGASQSPGALTAGGDIENIRPLHSSGVFTGVGGDLVYSGTFTVSSIAGEGEITPTWSGVTSGVKINTGTPIAVTNVTEGGGDPIVGYSPLTLTAVPEPTGILPLAVGTVGLLLRRRRNRIG